MKALAEVGFRKTSKFLLYSLVQIIYQLLFLPPLRRLFLITLGAKIGSGSQIMNVRFFNWHHKGPRGLKIGRDCFLGDETLIDLYDDITLEDQVTIAQRVTILSHLNVGYKDHPLQAFFPKKSKGVVLKNGSVVGASATILPGVTIGENSFVGAGSLVTHDVPQYALVAGVPAKVIRKIQ